MWKETVIVGAGPSGLATSACLNRLSIPNIILEREDCSASLWRKKMYDHLKLQLAKKFCALPHMPFPPSAPTFVSKDEFVGYLDQYVAHFDLKPVYSATVESAAFDGTSKTWSIKASNGATGEVEEYTARFLVVATGENGEEAIPDIPGLKSFPGEVIHSSCYKSGATYANRRFLVVGSGNSGMDIAFDLSNHGALVSVAVRSPFHVMTREMLRLGMTLGRRLPIGVVDSLLLTMSRCKYGDLSKYGIVRPKLGPLSYRAATGTPAVIDAGTIAKIKKGEIQVVKDPACIEGDEVHFSDGSAGRFDAIILATGYKTTANDWLKDADFILNEDGLPKKKFPDHWKGINGLYCAGLARKGLPGASMDARNIAKDIEKLVSGRNRASSS